MRCKTVNNVQLVGLVVQDATAVDGSCVSFGVNVLVNSKKGLWGADTITCVKVRMITDYPEQWQKELSRNPQPVKVLGCLVCTSEGLMVQARNVEFVKKWQEGFDCPPEAASNV